MIRIVPSIAVAVCLLYPASVRADSVTITSGSVALGSVRGNPSLAGTMIGENFMVSFRWADPSLPCPAGCRTGDVITLTSILHAPPFINPFGIPNTAENPSATVAYAGDLTFSGPAFVLPPVPAFDPSDPQGFPVHVLLSGPFTLTGILSAYSTLGRDPTLLYTKDLSGTGTVKAEFLAGPGQSYSLFPSVPRNQLQYDFAPVPEPGTLVLLGGGLAAAWIRARREARATRD